MSADILAVADAVVASLNAASESETFSQEFTAKRLWLPYMDLSSNELNTLKVSVVPRGLEQTRQDRVTLSVRPTIDVAVQKKVAAITDAVLDPLLQLVREINDFLFGQQTDIDSTVVLLGIANNPLYLPDHLQSDRVFTSLLSLTFRIR